VDGNMSEKKILKDIETVFSIELDSDNDAEIVYNSIKPEVNYAHNERSTTEIELKDNMIIIKIFSKDVVSLRASINSYVRWIKLSTEILKI
jgi:KEOPS complex subunit Pcc1